MVATLLKVLDTILPVFLVAGDWTDAAQAALAGHYLDWIAPALLTLQHLDRETRARLEQRLPVQSISVEYHWRLYPEVLNEGHLRAARVQGRLQHAKQNEGYCDG